MDGPVYLGGYETPSLVFTCTGAPRIYEIVGRATIATKDKENKNKKRLSFLSYGHKHIVSTCFTYRVLLRDATDIRLIRGLSSERHIPRLDRWIDRRLSDPVPYAEQLTRFLVLLRTQTFPFRIKYQLQMLVWNGELPASTVISLFPYAYALLSRRRLDIAVKVFQKLPRKLQRPSPDVDSSEFDPQRLIEILTKIEEGKVSDFLDTGKPGHVHQNQTEIHRATVTPTGIYLYGPYPETQNRVLRRFSRFNDFFLRVEFVEETGDPIMYDITSNLDGIFNDRFRVVLRDGIVIADRHFKFLGFSHSSLRARTCWFMAEFTCNGERVDVSRMIHKLGNFQDINSPAKVAARIGQTFSDTLTSIAIDPRIVRRVPDIERNGRVFSDGCGTLSKEVLWRINREYPRRVSVRPTVFQIRLSGAKGMLSLDSSKSGPEIMLRKSMVKFEAADDWNIEICGAGIEKLPCFLNAQLIKILEDLEVPANAFLALQADEIETLRQTVQSPEQTAKFLEQSHIARSTRLPWLICVLRSLDLRHTQDDFLRQAVELAILVKLRDLKYRARIRVPKAVTLYGIMDETGILNEGEIFCPVLSDRSYREILVRKDVIITRSPALHPGDVQLVNAVDVPEDSPLRNLHNCVVFSQKGSRDLPSKLSGGDLDGDLFNIIYDDRLRPRKIAEPADYPRGTDTVLNRAVEIDDIADFFVTFMRQDQLGRIATTHKILADQRPMGTFDPDCLTLAELHSTAVDFSKTGKPVDVSRIPRYPPYRPDFMAPGPRVHIAESIEILQSEREHLYGEEDDDDDDDDDSRPLLRYYKSKCVLGQLYRAIDEQEFLKDLQSLPQERPMNLLTALWQYVESKTAGFVWKDFIDTGKDIKEIYEDDLQDLMYQYSDTPWKASLTEIEVFIGNIMGESHKQTKRQKESSKSMREDYDRLVDWTISMILGRDSDCEGKSLERSIACFWVALNDATAQYNYKKRRLRSFAWIAAVVCLQEIDKRRMMIPFS
ncbi:hypothetical protein VTN77DRAFT_6002 [Rasamsonia byssochlamydoides]|uniref:uncharacterized protein n=1 Tax=Rasamsonia byssochlamydoides TaxID=89139 RepID=UPI00374484FB